MTVCRTRADPRHAVPPTDPPLPPKPPMPPISHLSRSARSVVAGAFAILMLALAGCDPQAGSPADAGAKPGGSAGKPAGPPGGGMPGPTVGVVTVQPADVSLSVELPGRLEAWRVAQVRARVPGIVEQRLFTEGAAVRAGQPLFRLDAAPYRATLASTDAAVARAEANVAQAQAQVQRNQPLADAKAISAQEWLVTQTTLAVAKADAATARAAAQTARINLDYALVKAPIDGRIGRSLVTEGALVGQGEATQLAVIQQTHPLYVNFTQSAAEALRLRRAFDSGQLKRAGAGAAAELRVLLDDGSEYPLPAKLLFTDPTVDAATGQVNLRAELPNPKDVLLPGLFVRVRLVQATSERAIRLPQQAVTRGPGGDSVLVVGADNKPMLRKIVIGTGQGNDWVVQSGLAAGERVIVDGVQKLAMVPPGTPVNPVPWSPPGKAGQAPAAGPAPASVAAPASAAPMPAPAASR